MATPTIKLLKSLFLALLAVLTIFKRFFFPFRKKKQSKTNFSILTQNHELTPLQKCSMVTPTIELLKMLFLALLAAVTVKRGMACGTACGMT